jgi:DNA-binding GntR family transcriptional regulator
MDTTSRGAEVPAIGNRQMLVYHVFESILSLLLDHALPTGSALNIDGLAKQFKVSSTPVREALARLEATGMVRREALRGYKVAPAPTASDISALLVTRQVLEPAIAHIACENVSPDLVADLEKFNRELDTSQLGGDTFAGYRAYWKADEMFHRRIAESTGNEFLLRAYNSVEGHIQRFRLLVHNDMSGEHTVGEHQAIIAAFQSNDPERARTAMSDHIDGIRTRSSNLAIFSDK